MQEKKTQIQKYQKRWIVNKLNYKKTKLFDTRKIDTRTKNNRNDI